MMQAGCVGWPGTTVAGDARPRALFFLACSEGDQPFMLAEVETADPWRSAVETDAAG